MKHSHYFKDVSRLKFVDVYRVLVLFGVTDPCLQHAIKKLLVAGGRGIKDDTKDVQEAIDSLLRWKAMRDEDHVDSEESQRLVPLPNHEFLMSSVDPVDTSFQWFDQMRGSISEEWAFKAIVRHLLKGLEAKLLKPHGGKTHRQIEEEFLKRVHERLRSMTAEAFQQVTIDRIATSVLSREESPSTTNCCIPCEDAARFGARQ